ncbi:hypothetical protein AN958_06556 [Leucoagaricus sp. SymC.cos]|nr:hypothetical protein AN958_06556 [Leucoagaricus sp. SymC.cos]
MTSVRLVQRMEPAFSHMAQAEHFSRQIHVSNRRVLIYKQVERLRGTLSDLDSWSGDIASRIHLFAGWQ